MTPRPTYDRRPYQRRSSYGVWIGLAVAAVLIVVAVIVVREQQARRPPPTQPSPRSTCGTPSRL